MANDPGEAPDEARADERPGWLAALTRPRRFELNAENLAWAAAAVGVLLRVWEYLEFRPLYLDERLLLKSLVGRAPFDFQQILDEDQMAPPAFLVIERLMVRLPLEVRAAGRLFPLLCAIASVFLMRGAARRYLDRRAAPIALALFAMGDHLLYYASEIKQYSTDLMVALLALLLAAPAPGAPDGPPRFRALIVFGLVAPWFSFTVVFLLAGIGLHQLFVALMRGDRRRAALTAGAGAAWLSSFAACFVLSKSLLKPGPFIWVWWNFAFLPLPPRTTAGLVLLANTLANAFINPGSLLAPFPLPATGLLASLLALAGAVALGRRWPGGLWIVASPLLFGLLASGLHQYPFHGRLLFYLVPTLLLTVAEGAAAVGRCTAWPATLILAGLLIYGEAAEIAWYKVIQPRARTFDSHGDVKNDLLDYLEFQARRKARMERPRPSEPGQEAADGPAAE